MHKPVLIKEVIDYLNIQERKIYVDCTLGLGGHSIEILKKLNGTGILIGIEQDELAFKIARENLDRLDTKNYYLFNCNFIQLKEVLRSLNINKITGGVFLDLGVNSLQLDTKELGFSFSKEAPLDMRMDRNQILTAYDVINKYPKDKLANTIYNYGEERFSRKIAELIVRNRRIRTTTELANIVLKCYPRHKRFKVHPATKTFQAIRIEVNNELENLEKFLCFTGELLLAGSRLTVISFHSLEDRIVKNFLKKSNEFKILTKKPTVPSISELRYNPRSRSAKLRAGEKI